MTDKMVIPLSEAQWVDPKEYVWDYDLPFDRALYEECMASATPDVPEIVESP